MNDFGDHKLIRLQWVNDERDVLIQLKPPGISPDLHIVFSYVTEVKVEMDFGRYLGAPLLWNSTFNQREDKQWEVLLDFAGAHDGFISLRCNEWHIEPEEYG